MTKKESQNGSTMGISYYTINEKVSKTRFQRHQEDFVIKNFSIKKGLFAIAGLQIFLTLAFLLYLISFNTYQSYNPVFDSLRKKKWLYPRFNEGCSHFSFCNDMCYIFFVPGFTCLVSLMIVRIDDFVINS